MRRITGNGLLGVLLAIGLMTAGCAGIPTGELLPQPKPAAPPPAATEETMTTPATPDKENSSAATKPEVTKSELAKPVATKPAEMVTPPVVNKAPVLSSDLTRGCLRGGDGTRSLPVGALAVDFTLDDTTGQRHTLSTLLAEKPVVMVFGSFT